MRALITGGAGFIGSHLAERCLERGDSVCVVDDLSTGSMENIQHLKGRPRFQYEVASVTNEPLIAELVDFADVVYHLAAAVGVRLIIESPVRALELNVRGTEVVLTMAAKKRKTVLLTSTSEVYGKREQVPFRESDDLVLGSSDLGRWSYACSKALDEFLALAYYREKKLPVVVVRLFNTVGPRQTGRYGMVLPTLVEQALAGADITVFGTGQQRRCFCHVHDAVTALVELAEHTGAAGQIFNVGSDEEVTILALAERIKAATGSSSRVACIPYQDAYAPGFEDMQRRVPDLSKVRALIGYRPTINLDGIISSVVVYCRERPAASEPRAQRTRA